MIEAINGMVLFRVLTKAMPLYIVKIPFILTVNNQTYFLDEP